MLISHPRRGQAGCAQTVALHMPLQTCMYVYLRLSFEGEDFGTKRKRKAGQKNKRQKQDFKHRLCRGRRRRGAVEGAGGGRQGRQAASTCLPCPTCHPSLPCWCATRHGHGQAGQGWGQTAVHATAFLHTASPSLSLSLIYIYTSPLYSGMAHLFEKKEGRTHHLYLPLPLYVPPPPILFYLYSLSISFPLIPQTSSPSSSSSPSSHTLYQPSLLEHDMPYHFCRCSATLCMTLTCFSTTRQFGKDMPHFRTGTRQATLLPAGMGFLQEDDRAGRKRKATWRQQAHHDKCKTAANTYTLLFLTSRWLSLLFV